MVSESLNLQTGLTDLQYWSGWSASTISYHSIGSLVYRPRPGTMGYGDGFSSYYMHSVKLAQPGIPLHAGPSLGRLECAVAFVRLSSCIVTLPMLMW